METLTLAQRNTALQGALQSAFGPGGRYESFGAEPAPGIEMPQLLAAPGAVYAAVDALKNDPEFAFGLLSYITATDELECAAPGEPRFRIVYFLLSLVHGWRLKVHTRAAESDAPAVKSLVPLYLGANWMEREVFDMFGIRFEGHPELRRILMPEEYIYYPLRKDFPLEGIQPDRLYREWETARDAAEHSGKPGN